MRTAYLHKNIVKTMKKKSYLFIGLSLVVMILITYLYYSVTYDDFQIQNIFRKMIREEDYFANEIDRAKIYRKKGVKTILLWKTLFGN